MSPNEHYREAERLLASARTVQNVLNNAAEDGRTMSIATVEAKVAVINSYVARAQVHATLATLGKRDEA